MFGLFRPEISEDEAIEQQLRDRDEQRQKDQFDREQKALEEMAKQKSIRAIQERKHLNELEMERELLEFNEKKELLEAKLELVKSECKLEVANAKRAKLEEKEAERDGLEDAIAMLEEKLADMELKDAKLQGDLSQSDEKTSEDLLKIESQYSKETRERKEKHDEKLSKLFQQKLEMNNTHEAELTKEEQKMAAHSIDMNKKERALLDVQMGNMQQLVDVHGQEDVHEEFRRNGAKVVAMVTEIEKAFSREEIKLLTVRDKIKKGQILKADGLPDFSDFQKKMEDTKDFLGNFDCNDAAENQEKYTNLRDTAIQSLNELTSVTGGISSKIEQYQDLENAEDRSGNEDYWINTDLEKAISLLRTVCGDVKAFLIPKWDQFMKTLREQNKRLTEMRAPVDREIEN